MSLSLSLSLSLSVYMYLCMYEYYICIDASGLIFEEWDPAQAVDKSQETAPMIINSSQWRAAGFKLDKVSPPQPEAAARSGMRTRGAGLRQLRSMGSERFVLNTKYLKIFKKQIHKKSQVGMRSAPPLLGTLLNLLLQGVKLALTVQLALLQH
jgi:hypothetical protein